MIFLNIMTYNKVFVNGATDEQLEKIRRWCMYQVDTKHMKKEDPETGEMVPSTWDGIVNLFNVNKKYFQVGLLHRIKKYLDRDKIQYKIKDMRVIHDSHRLNMIVAPGAECRDYQLEAVLRAKTTINSIINSATGSGKTYIGCEFIRMTQVNTLIVVPNITLVNQWVKALTLYFKNVPELKIGRIGEGKCDIQRITVSTYQSLSKHPDKFEPLKIFFKSIIYDECHQTKAKIWKQIQHMFENYYSLGLSATPLLGSSGENLLVESVCGPQVMQITNTDLQKRNFLSKVRIKCKALNYPSRYRYYDYDSIIKAAVVNNDERHTIICKDAMKLVAEGRVTMVLVEYKDHGRLLQEKFKELFDLDVPFISGKDKSDVRDEVIYAMRKKEIRLIIATKVFEIGLDIPEMSGLVLASTTKSPIKAFQRVGRVTRLCEEDEMIVIDYFDKIKYLSVHFNQRRSYYDTEEGWVKEDVVHENTINACF